MTGKDLVLRMAAPEKGNLLDVVSSLYNDTHYTDLKIHYQGKVFKVHKAIVCPQVNFFAACVSRIIKESQTGRIRLDDEIPEIVSYFIDFLYKENYHAHLNFDGKERISPDFPQATNSPLLVHSHMYTLADKYFVRGLKKLAAKKFENALEKLSTDQQLSTLVSTLKTVFKGPKDMVLQSMCAKKAADLYSKLLFNQEFHHFCRENGEAALAIMQEVWMRLLGVQDELEEAKKENLPPKCPGCKDTDHVRVSSVSDVSKYGGGFYCTACRRNFTREEVEYAGAADNDVFWGASAESFPGYSTWP